MDDFVKKAFEDAKNISDDAEYAAYMRNVSDAPEAIILTATAMTGLENVERMATAIVHNGEQGTFAEFLHNVVMTAFHVGYKASKEEAV